MKIICIISQKGGATKTTLSIHLAVMAQQEGKQAAIIDLDPQASCAKWKDLREVGTPVVVSAQPARLSQVLEAARGAGADIVIIDTAPHSNLMTLDAARIADFILIPTKCGILDLQAVSSSVDMAAIAKRPAAIVLCAVPVRGATAEQAREALKPLGLEVCPITTGDRAAYRNALVSGLTAQEYEPDGKAAEEVKALYKWVSNKVIL